IWFGHYRAPKCEHLLLAVGQRTRILALALAQPRKHVEHLVGERAHLRGLFTVLECPELQVFLDGEKREDASAFRNERDTKSGALVGWQARDVVAAEMDR